jgi:hypothetical protein
MQPKQAYLKTVLSSILVILIFCGVKAQGPTFLWAKQFSGNGTILEMKSTVDHDGNFYITGNFNGTYDFDPGIGTYYMSASLLSGHTDIFVLKLDPSGNLMWAQQFGNSRANTSAIALDKNEDLYVSGFIYDTVDFDAGPDVHSLSPTIGGAGYCFTLKLDIDGKFIWVKHLYPASTIVSSEDDKLYTIAHNGGSTIFTKINSSGDLIWQKSFYAYSNSIVIDKNENIYMTGTYVSDVDFDPGPAINKLYSGGMFVCKFDSLGALIWATNPSKNPTSGEDITVDNNGNVYITGSFVSNFVPGRDKTCSLYHKDFATSFISKLDVEGNCVWSKQLEGDKETYGYKVIVDSIGNVYSIGTFVSTCDLDPGPNIYNVTRKGNDSYVSALDSSGNFKWGELIGTNFSINTSNSLKFVRRLNVYSTGTFVIKTYFDREDTSHNLVPVGQQNCFVVKFGDPRVIIPQIFFDRSLLKPGETISISGKYFTPRGSIKINFSGVGDYNSNDITADTKGEFRYAYNVPANVQTGNISVQAYDSISGNYSQERSFQIQSLSTQAFKYLQIISPQNGGPFLVNQTINVGWSDKLQRKYGSIYYSMSGATGNRLYRYRIEYQLGSTGTWQLAKVLDGSGSLNSVINLSEPISIASKGDYRFRIVDDYIQVVADTSAYFSVTQTANNIKAELIWDNSFPITNVKPQGVAADGVSRLYISVNKIDENAGLKIQNVTISLSNGSDNSTSMLGKVKAVSTPNIYSLEANDANLITANSNSLPNNTCWFWYVAPDDFSENNYGENANKNQRTVVAHIIAQLSDGSTDNTDVKIAIVRPPLILAHGLASDATAWNEFKELFVNTSLFIYSNAISLEPHDPFNSNAYLLLNPYISSDGLSSLQGNILKLRKLGFACNQVDYVCHSMGGCVLRTAMTTFKDKFYGLSGYSNDIFKSYEKGFVHKAITLATPHKNSPVADGITEYVPQATWEINLALSNLYKAFPNAPLIWDYIEPVNPGALFSTSFQSTPAVKDLQVSDAAGGKNLGTTIVKNHLIAGDVDIYSPETAQSLAEFDHYLDLMDQILKTMLKFSVDPVKSYLKTLLVLEKTVRVFTFIEWYSEQKGFPNFLGDGDLVVPLNSQLAGLSSSSSNVTVFKNTAFLNSNHLNIKKRDDVGKRVKELLNTAINSSLFADVIPATPAGARLNNYAKENKISSGQIVQDYDDTKIKIIRPTRNVVLKTDSSVEVYFQLTDTSGLIYVETEFESESFTSISKAYNQGYVFQLDPNYIDKQLISVTAVYDKANGTESHTDTLSVNIIQENLLLDFEVLPKVATPKKDQLFYPKYLATYNTSVNDVANNDSSLKVIIADTSFVHYDINLHAFIAIMDTGSTYAAIDYRGKQDTIYFINTLESICGRLKVNVTIKGDTVLCSGDSLSLNAPIGMTSYLWSNGQTTSAIKVTSAGNYSVKVVDSLGCSANAQAVKIVVNPLPDKPGTITGNNSFCEGSNENFSINVVNNATSYTWALPSGWTGNSTTNSIQSVVGGQSGNITVKTNNSCGSSESQTLAVNVRSSPSRPQKIKGKDSICLNSSHAYNVDPIANASSYTWELPPGWTGNSTTDSIIVTPNSTDGTITVKANNECGSSAIQSLPVIVKQLPSQLTPIIGSNTTCKDSAQTFSVNTVTNATSYIWTLPAGWTGNSSNNSISTIAGSNGGTIAVKATNGCGESQSQTLFVAVNQPPAQPENISGNPIVATNQATSYSINPVNGANSYKWILNGGGTLSTKQDSIGVLINWTTIGNYALSVYAINNCGNSIAQSLNVSVSAATAIINPDNAYRIQIAPNPSSGEFYLTAKGVINKEIKIEIFNLLGQNIYQFDQKIRTNNYSKTINLKNATNGVYVIKMSVDKKTYLRTIIKQ